MLKKISRSNLTAIAAIAAASVLVYLPSRRAPFFFDDIAHIVHNTDIRDIKNISDKLWRAETYQSRIYPYRPLVYISFAANYKLSGLNPAAYRAVNIAIHTLVCILIFILTRKIWICAFGNSSTLYPLLTALIYCLHPLQTEAVTYIVHREDSMCMLFYLLSVLTFIWGAEKHAFFYVISLLSFTLAALCKEMAVMLPFTLLLFDYIFMCSRDLQKMRARAKIHAIYFCAMTLYILFRWTQLRGLGREDFLSATWTPLSYLSVQPWVILNYIRLLIAPFGQSIDHFILPPANNADLLKTFAGWLGISAILFTVWKHTRKNTAVSSIILFTAGWFFLNLVPTSSILPINDAMAERRLYVPGWSYALAVTALLYFWTDGHSQRFRVLTFTLVTLYLSLITAFTIRRNYIYTTPIRLWQETIALYPTNFRAHNNLANLYADRKEFAPAIDEYLAAIKIHPRYASAHSNLALVLCETKDYPRALEYSMKAAALNPRRADPCNVMGRVYAEQARYKESELAYLKGIELDPQNISANAGLGLLYYQTKKLPQAAQIYERLLSVEPLHLEAVNNLGLTYYELKNYPKSLEYFERAVELAPHMPAAYINIGNIYLDMKKYDLALTNYTRAAELSPSNAMIQFNQGLVYLAEKKPDEALTRFQKAAALNPGYVEAYFQMGEIFLVRKDYTQSLQNFEKVLKADPSDPYVKRKVEYLKELALRH